MEGKMNVNLLRCLILALCGALAAGTLLPLPAAADMVDDWFARKIPAAEPKIGYAGEPVQLKFSHPNPPASLVPPIWRNGMAWLQQATGGKLTLKEFGAGTLHGPRDGFKAVRSNISDYATCFVASEARGFPLTKVFELPFVTPSNPLAGVRITAELAPKYFKPEYDRQGVHFGYQVLVGAADIMSKKPIRKLEDMKGLKVIVQGFEPEVADALGAVIVNVPFPDIYTSLQQGVVDAVLWVDPGFVPYKIFELAKYHTTLGLSAQKIDTCLNPKSFAALPTDLKQTFYEFQQRMAFAVAKRIGVDFRKEARAKYAEQKVEMITLAPEEMARWKAALKPLVDKWAAKHEAEGPTKALLADIERLTAKYNGMSDDQLFKLIVEQPVKGIIEF
jgi:TRAP-type C4-dicarboxylate transport system substrate-binding protein